jgi:hypothetical protein
MFTCFSPLKAQTKDMQTRSSNHWSEPDEAHIPFYWPSESGDLPDFLKSDLSDRCVLPEVEAVHIVRFKTYASVEIKITADIGHRFYIREISRQDKTILLADRSGLPHISLPLDGNYELLADNSCGATEKVVEFTTKKPALESIGVTGEFFSFLMSVKKKPDYDLYKEVQEAELYSYHERLAFIQQYFLGGDDLETLRPGEFPSASLNRNEDCRCQFVVALTKLANPYKIGNDGELLLKGVSTPKVTFNGSNGNARTWSDMKEAGAAKRHFLFTEGFKAPNSQVFRDTIYRPLDNDNTIIDSVGLYEMTQLNFINYSVLRLAYLCSNPEQVRNCTCEKRVKLNWYYTSALSNKAVIHDCCMLTNKFAQSQAYDKAYTFLWKEKADELIPDLEILAAKGATQTALCKKIYNNMAVDGMNILFDHVQGTAKNIVLLTTALQSLQNGALTAVDTFLNAAIGLSDTFQNTINDFLDLEVWDELSCDDNSESSFNMKGETFTSIGVNDQVALFLLNETALYSAGMKAWYSHAGVVSSAKLSMMLLPLDFEDPGSEACCTKPVSQWIYSTGSFNESQSIAAMRTDIASALFPYQWPSFTVPMLSGFAPKPYYGHDVAVNANDCETLVQGRVANYEPQADKYTDVSNCKYTLTDYTGRVIGKGVTLDEHKQAETVVRYLQDVHVLQSGFYIMHFHTPHGVSNYRFSLNF